MKKTIFVCVSILILACFSEAKATADTLFSYLKGSFDLAEGRDSFYVFALNPNGGTSTIGHTVKLDYKAIRKYSACQDILFVLAEGVSPAQINMYFEEVLKIPVAEIGRENIRIDEKLYRNLVTANGTSDILYFYRQKLFYHEITKFGDPRVVYVTPYDKYEIEVVSDVLLDTSHYQTITSFYTKNPYNSKQFIQISDVNSRAALINKNTGKIEKVQDRSSISILDLYAKHVDKSEKRLKLVEEGINWLEANNRP
ncbi:MAG: hypothetical protein JJT94_01685, partial [Bernardetiaceae bacterium]|nr:hypothetical protein [Bernardetiaceae bacterium]